MSEELPEEEVVERAKTLGWKEPEEWKGDPPPGGFVDARTFLKKADDALPVLRANNERLHAEIREMRKTFEEFSNYHKQTVAQAQLEAFERAKAEIVEKQKEAILAGDADTFQTLQDKREAMVKQEAQRFHVKPAQDDTEAVRARWEAENPWFRNDFQLHRTAKEAAEFLVQSGKQLTSVQFLDEMKKIVAEQHPDHDAFAEKRLPSYDGGGRQVSGSGRKPQNSYENMPREHREQCDRFVKHGLGSKEFFLEEYYKYNGPD